MLGEASAWIKLSKYNNHGAIRIENDILISTKMSLWTRKLIEYSTIETGSLKNHSFYTKMMNNSISPLSKKIHFSQCA